MSNALAIAAVTKVIREHLHGELTTTDLSSLIGGDVTISTTTIDSLKTGGEKEQLNLFLYHIAPNQGLQNAELPARDRNGQVVTRPYLALDLYYILTAHGGDQVKAQMLLGYAMRALHDWPVLSPKQITAILKDDVLAGSGIEDQVDSIRISPYQLSLDDESKLWSALQTNMRTSAAYRVSTVIITSELERRVVLPVISRDIKVVTMRRPHLESAAPSDIPRPETYIPDIILAGEEVTLKGNDLGGDSLQMLMDGKAFPGTVGKIGADTIDITLPDDLECGVHTVQCDVKVRLADAVDRYVSFRSNPLPMIVSPSISRIKRSDDGKSVEVTIKNQLRAGQVSQLFLYPVVDGKATDVPALTAVLGTPTGSTFLTPSDDLSGEFLARMAVDGTLSPVVIENDSGLYADRTKVVL